MLEYRSNSTIHTLFEQQVRKTPYATAIIFNNQNITYSELNKQANLLAHSLRSQGTTDGSTIAIMVKPSIQMIIGILAILKTGSAFIPVDPDYPKDRVEYFLTDSGAKFLLSQSPYLNLFDFKGTTINLDQVSNHISSPEDQQVNVSPEHLAYVMYTSGSTGRPKGVMIEHHSVVNYFLELQKRIDFSPQSTILFSTSFSFDIALNEILFPLTTGMKIVIADEQQRNNPRLLASMISNYSIDVLQATPSRLFQLLSDPHVKKKLSTLSIFLIGGEQFTQALLQKVKSVSKAKIFNLYGPTEATVFTSIKELTNHQGPITIGQPLAGTSLHIMNEKLEILDVGQEGELFISGKGVARGYLNAPDLTKEKFLISESLNKRVYRTGDIAKQEANGEFTILGRSDHLIKVRGFRVHLFEIKEALLRCKEIDDAEVVSFSEDEHITGLHAYFVSDTPLSRKYLRDHLKTILPHYMIPSKFTRLDSIPLSLNGKIDINKLSKEFI